MRIGNSSFTENVFNLYQKNQSGTPQETTYQDLLQAAVGDVQNAQEPRDQIWMDYQDWKERQPARKLPDSQGATDENIAYLRENFSGELLEKQLRSDGEDDVAGKIQAVLNKVTQKVIE